MYLLYKDVKCPAKNLAFRKSLEKCCRYQNAVNRNLHLLELSPKDWLTLRLVFFILLVFKKLKFSYKMYTLPTDAPTNQSFHPSYSYSPAQPQKRRRTKTY